MLGYILRRLAIGIPTLFLLALFCFVLMHLAPGNPFNSEKPLPPAVMENLLKRYNLDQPVWRQFLDYIGNILFHFDFGPSFSRTDMTVNDIIAKGFPVTLTYGFYTLVLATFAGIGLGVIAALRQNTWIDYLAVGISIGSQVFPNFVLGPLMILIFTLWLGWLPGGGWNGGQWNYLILPVVTLATSYFASIARLTRASMIEVLNSPYIRTARAKGIPERTIILRHALKPAILPAVSYLGPVAAYVICGSVFIDKFFSTGGIGQDFIDAAYSRDYSVLTGLTILYGGILITVTLLVDLIYAWIDPKVRASL